MLTINYNGKTYKQGPNSVWSINALVQSAIENGGLVEEVEENTEEKVEKHRGTVYDKESVLYEAPSILEKLREELEKVVRENIGIAHVAEKARCNLAQKLLKLLTSLETKEEPDRTQQTKDITGMFGLCMDVKPQFTPGQEDKIEPELPEVPQLKEIIAYSNDTELALIAWAREMTTFIQSLARQKPTK